MTPIIDPEKEVKIETYINNMTASAGFMVIKTEDELKHAIDFVKGIKTAIKRLDNDRLELVKPIKQSVKLIEEKFNRFIRPLEGIEERVRGLVYDYTKLKRDAEEQARQAAEEAKQAELARLEEEHNKKLAEIETAIHDDTVLPAEMETQLDIMAEQYAKDIEAVEMGPKMIEPVPTTVHTENAKMVVRTVWKYEIVNKPLVPHAYLVVDERTVRADVKAGVREIPGIRIFEDFTNAI